MKKLICIVLFSLILLSCHNDIVYDYYPIYNGTEWIYRGVYSDSDSIFSVWTVIDSNEEGVGNVYKTVRINFIGNSFYYPVLDTIYNDTFFIYKDRDKVEWRFGDSLFTILKFPLYLDNWWIGYGADTCFVVGDTSVVIGEYLFDDVVIIKVSSGDRYYFSNSSNLIMYKNNGINMYLKSVVWGQ